MKNDTPRSSTTAKMWHDDGSGAKTVSMNNTSNICIMHQISNMHHYLQVQKLGEAGDLKAAEAKELLSSSNVGSLLVNLHIHAIEKSINQSKI
jgi:hypothetical protein